MGGGQLIQMDRDIFGWLAFNNSSIISYRTVYCTMFPVQVVTAQYKGPEVHKYVKLCLTKFCRSPETIHRGMGKLKKLKKTPKI